MNNNIARNFFKLAFILSVIDLASRYMTASDVELVPPQLDETVYPEEILIMYCTG